MTAVDIDPKFPTRSEIAELRQLFEEGDRAGRYPPKVVAASVKKFLLHAALTDSPAVSFSVDNDIADHIRLLLEDNGFHPRTFRVAAKPSQSSGKTHFEVNL